MYINVIKSRNREAQISVEKDITINSLRLACHPIFRIPCEAQRFTDKEKIDIEKNEQLQAVIDSDSTVTIYIEDTRQSNLTVNLPARLQGQKGVDSKLILKTSQIFCQAWTSMANLEARAVALDQGDKGCQRFSQPPPSMAFAEWHDQVTDARPRVGEWAILLDRLGDALATLSKHTKLNAKIIMDETTQHESSVTQPLTHLYEAFKSFQELNMNLRRLTVPVNDGNSQYLETSRYH